MKIQYRKYNLVYNIKHKILQFWVQGIKKQQIQEKVSLSSFYQKLRYKSLQSAPKGRDQVL